VDHAEIPLELPTRSVFAINRKAAAALGITLQTIC
jgi:hypothetical protein